MTCLPSFLPYDQVVCERQKRRIPIHTRVLLQPQIIEPNDGDEKRYYKTCLLQAHAIVWTSVVKSAGYIFFFWNSSSEKKKCHNVAKTNRQYIVKLQSPRFYPDFTEKKKSENSRKRIDETYSSPTPIQTIIMIIVRVLGIELHKNSCWFIKTQRGLLEEIMKQTCKCIATFCLAQWHCSGSPFIIRPIFWKWLGSQYCWYQGMTQKININCSTRTQNTVFPVKAKEKEKKIQLSLHFPRLQPILTATLVILHHCRFSCLPNFSVYYSKNIQPSTKSPCI